MLRVWASGGYHVKPEPLLRCRVNTRMNRVALKWGSWQNVKHMSLRVTSASKVACLLSEHALLVFSKSFEKAKQAKLG